MLHKRNFMLIAIASLFLFFENPLHAQEKFVLASGTDLKVEGTSTLHDWEMVSNKAGGEAKIKLNGNQLESITGLKVTFPVSSLQSGKSQMDNIAHETLKADKHPEIRFELREVQQITDKTVKASGNLTIAGTTRPVVMEVNYDVNGKTISFTGAKGIKFTDFKVDPPKAMFGTIKTGDELQLSMNATFKSANEQVSQ